MYLKRFFLTVALPHWKFYLVPKILNWSESLMKMFLKSNYKQQVSAVKDAIETDGLDISKEGTSEKRVEQIISLEEED